MYDIIGNIAILKKADRKLAKQLLKNRNIKTVLVKAEKVKGKLRTMKVKWLAGEKTTLASYVENNCKFKLDVEKCYFSSRLASERKEIASKIKKNQKVLVLFGGIAPFAIVIAKLAGSKVVSVELGKACCKYAKENVGMNKLFNKVRIVQGDVKKLRKLIKGKFNVVVMPRPQLKSSYLQFVVPFVKRGSMVYYYDFGRQEELARILQRIKKDFKKPYKIMRIRRVGEIAPYKFRFRIDLLVK